VTKGACADFNLRGQEKGEGKTEKRGIGDEGGSEREEGKKEGEGEKNEGGKREGLREREEGGQEGEQGKGRGREISPPTVISKNRRLCYVFNYKPCILYLAIFVFVILSVAYSIRQ